MGLIFERLAVLEKRKLGLITYLQTCITEDDWHGVSDAANDLREVTTEIESLNRALEWIEKSTTEPK